MLRLNFQDKTWCRIKLCHIINADNLFILVSYYRYWCSATLYQCGQNSFGTIYLLCFKHCQWTDPVWQQDHSSQSYLWVDNKSKLSFYLEMLCEILRNPFVIECLQHYSSIHNQCSLLVIISVVNFFKINFLTRTSVPWDVLWLQMNQWSQSQPLWWSMRRGSCTFTVLWMPALPPCQSNGRSWTTPESPSLPITQPPQ